MMQLTAKHEQTIFRLVLAVMFTAALMIGGHGVSAAEERVDDAHAGGEPGGHGGGHGHSSRITDEYIPLQLDGFPQRPSPLLEIGQNFLGTGTLARGIHLPTGAVWQPYFMVFGTLRTGLQTFNNGSDNVSEWANRFDLFGNLYLTFTERVLVGIRPLDRDGKFFGKTFAPEELSDEFQDEINGEITTLFMEGDFGEIFPFLDREDGHGFDYGFAVGRQPISFQEGILINDNIDAVGLTKINWKALDAVNFRWTLLYGWNELNRTNLAGADESSRLYGLLTETDWRKNTMAIDIIYVDADEMIGDGVYVGWSTVQRYGFLNSSFRVLASIPVNDETIHNSEGYLFFFELSKTPHGNHNLVYLNGFASINNFVSASRAPSAGGPLGRTGILFAAPGLGRYGAALSNMAYKAFGGSLGYQWFFDHTRKQFVLEIGGRGSSSELGQDAAAIGGRYQMALGRRFVVQLDGFGVYEAGQEALDTEDDFRVGGRFEILARF
jgi:hypothetical protein